MSSPPSPTEAIRAARRSLEGRPGVRIAGELLWYHDPGVWAFRAEFSIDAASPALIPATTPWYVVIEPRYPWGSIEIYPAKQGGIDKTFAHQIHNGSGDKDLPWRAGNICVQAAGFTLGRKGHDPDPKGDPDRLLWYADQTIEWLIRASRGELLSPGENFELPNWPEAPETTVGFNEDGGSFQRWGATEVNSGVVELVPLGKSFAVRRFCDPRGSEVLSPGWGAMVAQGGSAITGAWIRLKEVPVVPPYAAPSNWRDLTDALERQNLNLSDLLRPLLERLRESPARILLIGCPIPRKVGELSSLMHWQPVLLPVLSSGKGGRNGFRRKSLAQRDLLFHMSGKQPVQWVRGRNWAEPEFSTRGRLKQVLRSKRILLVGAGALGAVVAELLIRGGANRILIIDNDRIAAGNLVRHPLSMYEIGLSKSRALAARLNALTPHANAKGVPATFPILERELTDEVGRSDLIIDCTGSDDALAALSDFAFDADVDFASISTGRGAKRLYFFTARGRRFPAEAFHDQIASWLQRDTDEFGDQEFPWESTGCWHPVFPARADDMWKFAALAVRELNDRIPFHKAKLLVLGEADNTETRSKEVGSGG